MIPSPSFSRIAPTLPLPPYSYVPGHDLPHPVNDPRGHSFGAEPRPLTIAELPSDPDACRDTLTAVLVTNIDWFYARELFNAGYYWEAHEAWEHFWNALGRTTPEARCVQGLIHLAAAAVKIREGKPAGVSRHTQRARELFGDPGNSSGFEVGQCVDALGLSRASIAAVVAELGSYRPECWHTSRTPVVRVVASDLKMSA
jgi:predicted metal-dependent hydrolase